MTWFSLFTKPCLFCQTFKQFPVQVHFSYVFLVHHNYYVIENLKDFLQVALQSICLKLIVSVLHIFISLFGFFPASLYFIISPADSSKIFSLPEHRITHSYLEVFLSVGSVCHLLAQHTQGLVDMAKTLVPPPGLFHQNRYAEGEGYKPLGSLFKNIFLCFLIY